MKPRLFVTTCITAVYLVVLLLAGAEAQNHSSQIQESSPSMAAETPPRTITAEPRKVSLLVGKSILVDSPVPIERVALGLGDFAVASAVSPFEVLLDGKAPGVTSMIIWQQDGNRVLYDVEVLSSRLEEIERQIQLELPGQDLHLTAEGDVTFLRGRVKDVTSADRAVSIASTLGKAVNLLYVDVPAQEPQILLRVKFASVDRNLSSQLGVNLFSTGATNTIGATATGQFAPPAFGSSSSGPAPGITLSDALNVFLFRSDLNLGATIQALQTRGLLEILSEPNMLAQNGKQASFLAGGEFPFPVVQGSTGGGSAAVTIQFREFGVRLIFLPTITPRGNILLRVSPEVSALDFTHGLTVNGFAVPALTVRKLNTVVELHGGQSFAIGGLLDNRVTDTFEKIPFLGDIPVLGKFFQSRNRNKESTELMVIVTPEIVQPVPQGQTIPDLHLPIPLLPENTSRSVLSSGDLAVSATSVAPPGPALPIEKLLKAIQMEQPDAKQMQQTASPTSIVEPAGFSTGAAVSKP